jgi:osmoprotectant transport system permease protein
MTRGQELRRVELPLAMPVIVAGIRTATVWTVGMATLSTPVGAPSLGNYIFTGLQTRNSSAILVGCVAAALLALGLDALVRGLEAGVRRRRRGLVTVTLAAFAVLYAYAGVTFARGLLGRNDERITIGAKTFTEQYILSEILARQIESATGLETNVAQSLGSTVAFDALRTGEIDIYVDYSGTIWATIMKREGVPENRQQVVDEVRDYLEEEHGVTLVGALGFENAYALAMREQDALELGIERISELALHSRRMSIGGDYEFFGRAEWQSIQSTYGLEFDLERSMDPSLMYQAVAQGDVDVISAFSTDGRIAAFDLRVLEDERGAIPPYDAIILASPGLTRRHPAVVEALAALDGAIDAGQMRRMNLAVDQEGLTPAEVADRYLQEASGPVESPSGAR